MALVVETKKENPAIAGVNAKLPSHLKAIELADENQVSDLQKQAKLIGYEERYDESKKVILRIGIVRKEG